MKLLFITCGLPGAGYHGGAVTCWAIIKMMLKLNHKVIVFSLFDESQNNPYLESKELQIKELKDIGAEVEIINYNADNISGKNKFPKNPLFSLKFLANSVIPRFEVIFPWFKLRNQVKDKIKQLSPDKIFCYHFDALSSLCLVNDIPIMAGVGDLWHLPGIYRWKLKKPSFKKYFLEGPYRFFSATLIKHYMIKMLRKCKKKGAFAFHYHNWFKKNNKFLDMLYLPTPVHDSVGESWENLKTKHSKDNRKAKVLMIGDISGTAAKWGFRLLVDEIIPYLERNYLLDKFEINIVGGGKKDENIKKLLKYPNINFKGRVIPPDYEFLSANILFVPIPISLGIRVKIITAFSYGLCVVSHIANTEGIPELVHEYNGFVSGTGLGLAKELIRAIEYTGLRRKIEVNSRKTFKDIFSEEVAARKIVEEIVTM